MNRIDLHTHTFLSDGELLPAELVSRAEGMDYEAIAIADHVGPSNLDRVLDQAVEVKEGLNDELEVEIIPGVELTYVPLSILPDLARQAKEKGAEIVIVHGETIVEPVPPGTNLTALNCDDVDILSHPGVISIEEAELAEETGTYLELTSRDGHSLTNGRVAKFAEETGAKLLVNTDAHDPEDLITQDEARAIAVGAGLNEDRLEKVLVENPRGLLGGRE